MKPKLLLGLALVLGGGWFGCSTIKPSGTQVLYQNAKYDFTFSLPASWQRYSVLTQQWDGECYSPALDKTVAAGHGQEIVLRHPQWTASAPCQDIPILIFTRSQWDALKQGKLWPSPYAGGIMDEMWHNRKYVFAISSRYNADDSVRGWKEADKIINRNLAAHPEPTLYPKP
jgi:hypothetical protein